MKTDTRMILAPLAALAVAFGAQAFSPQSEDFESYTVGEGVGGIGKFCFVAPDGVYDESTVQEANNNKYLQVSVEEGALFRSINDPNNGDIGADATVGPQGIDVDMSMKFTVTAAGDEPEYSADDKLSLWLQDEGSATNLMARGGLYTGSAGSYTLTPGTGTVYRLTGVTVTPGVWTSVKLKAIADIGGEGIPGFEVWVGETRATVTLADGLSAQVANTAVPSMSSSATLAAVGFSGEGAVDNIAITDNVPAGITFDLAEGVTSSYAAGVYTFMSPAGYVFDSFTVNGAPVTAAAGEGSYAWDAVAGAAVAVTVRRYIAEHPWYECPNGVVLMSDLPESGSSAHVSAFHGQGEGEYLGLTYTTGPKQFDLFMVDGTNTPTTLRNVAKADLPADPVPGLRGVAISKTLGVAVALSYYGTNTMYAFQLGSSGDPTAVSKPTSHAFDAAAFSPDGRYLFSNTIEGESSNQYFVKWSVAKDENTGAISLTKVDSIDAGGRGRSMAYARINGRDLVFGLVDTGKIVAIDMTGDTAANWTTANIVTNLPAHSYGTLCVSGVKANAPHLTVATSMNNDAKKGTTNAYDVVNVYALTVPGSGTISQTLVKSFDQAAMTAYGFGDISDANRYGNTVYVTDDEKTIYFARPDNNLYAAEYFVAASVDGTLYSKFESAVAAIAAGTTTDDYVTLLADVSTTMAVGDTLRVKTNGYTLTRGKATEDVLFSDSNDETDPTITIYTAIAGVAKCGNIWYASFGDAYAAALAAGGNAEMVVRITEDFTPVISATYNHFYSLTFEDVRSDQSTGLTINLKNTGGTAYMASSRYFFPENATLVLAANWTPWTAGLATGGIIEIPEDVTVTLLNGSNNCFAFDGLAGISGTGRLAIANDLDSNRLYNILYYYNAPNCLLAQFMRNERWQGTFELAGTYAEPFVPTRYVSANSRLAFNGFTVPTLGDTTSTYGMGIELLGSGLTLDGDYTRLYNFTGALSGSGDLNVTAMGSGDSALFFYGDLSGFSGSVNLASTTARVVFGASSTAMGGGSITVASGTTMTIPSTSAWQAKDLGVMGTLTANGAVTLSAGGKLWGNTGTGVYRANVASAAVTAASSWNGTYVIGWAGANDTAIAFDSYGNANSTIEIPEGSTLQGYVQVTANNTLTNAVKELVVNGTLNLSNGYDFSTVGWKKISGSGTVKFAFTPSHWIKEQIVALDGFSGSIEVSATTQLEIGTVNIAREPSADQLIVPLTVTSGGTVGGDLNLTVSGSAAGTLEYKADGANGAGLYVKASAVVIPVVSPGTNTTYECGSADAATTVAAAMNAAKADYIKAPEGALIADGSAAATAYANLFTARADGSTVVLELNESGTNALETAATNIAAQIVSSANLASILSDTRSISVTGAQPGFYYAVVYSANLATLDTAGTESGANVANAEGGVNLNMPYKTEGATAGFYRVKVYVTAPQNNQ